MLEHIRLQVLSIVDPCRSRYNMCIVTLGTFINTDQQQPIRADRKTRNIFTVLERIRPALISANKPRDTISARG